MTSFTPSVTSATGTKPLSHLQGAQATPSATSSSSSQQRPCIVYIGAEATFHLEISQVVACFQKQNILAEEKNLSSATHFVLFVTDGLLKSKEKDKKKI